MKKFEYKFVEVPIKSTLKTKVGDTFEKCKDVIILEAQNGWRLKQVVIPANEKFGAGGTYCYQIIFEKESI